MEAMDLAPTGGPPLRFQESGIVGGVFKISAADGPSLEWVLCTHIPAWEGRAFEALKFSDLRRQVKANVFVPGVSKSNLLILSRPGQAEPRPQVRRLESLPLGREG